MPKKSEHPLEKKVVRLVEGDAETLGEFYPAIGYNQAIREIVHQHVKILREKYNREGATDHATIQRLADSISAGDIGD